VNGDDQEWRSEWRERLEADRARRFDEKSAAETLALAALLDIDVGQGPQVGEFARAVGEQRKCPGRLADGLPGRKQ